MAQAFDNYEKPSPKIGVQYETSGSGDSYDRSDIIVCVAG
jgi:hypothetical protein